MKARYLILLFALLLVLTACAPQVTPQEPEIPEPSEEVSPPVTKVNFSDKLQHQMEQEYAGKLDFQHDTVIKTLGKAKVNSRYQAYFKENPEKAYDAVRSELNDLLPFRSEGSLIGPIAPDTYEAAYDYVRAEFEGTVTEEGQEIFDILLANMENDTMNGPELPYDENAQRNFDAARRYIWDHFGCDIESNSYFLQSQEE